MMLCSSHIADTLFVVFSEQLIMYDVVQRQEGMLQSNYTGRGEVAAVYAIIMIYISSVDGNVHCIASTGVAFCIFTAVV